MSALNCPNTNTHIHNCKYKIFIANVIASPEPKCLRYIVLSGGRTRVHQYLLLMPQDMHHNDDDKRRES